MRGSQRWGGSRRATRESSLGWLAADNVGKLEKEPIKGMIYEGRIRVMLRLGFNNLPLNYFVVLGRRRIRRRVPVESGTKDLLKTFFRRFFPGKGESFPLFAVTKRFLSLEDAEFPPSRRKGKKIICCCQPLFPILASLNRIFSVEETD